MMQLPGLAPGHYFVFLEDLRRKVRLGVLAHEKDPQLVSFDLAMVLRRENAGDGMEDVVDYNHLRDAVLALTAERHFGLQETLCEAILDRLTALPGVYGAVVETRKLSVYEDASAVGCRMTRVDPSVLTR
ncbi:dihydroneopterin aldolase [Parvularcula dongshanensis]|uniref:Dihydroneopterin aldolase n=1 Tax=Parvularcula dongshanensis TaxID=1173995 RepID=A0A840I4W4_9PROT|nr:dihydroneopterin aldolase [Parvularcula dongshanensis]MBB4659827.1 dihydroneopterin aldolase [Parvularcula dongshanensis]